MSTPSQVETDLDNGQITQQVAEGPQLRFIDLFAGLGGFHLALTRLGHRGVFASEINPGLQDLYERNFGLRPAGDIRLTPVEDIPPHDIICAGFPCQPFSKAGAQEGFDHPRWGDLFDQVLRIANYHSPKYVLLENVRNLHKHDEGRTWETIKAKLRASGYDVQQARGPHGSTWRAVARQHAQMAFASRCPGRSG